ncbi:hypothetical protein [Pseudarthrobacter phenanthrenivorans]|uniref:Uncharacterized protein n=1 Tax=Pseudarthrobacter phenanthrenivorans TaxID=361575 RepID=A0A0B4DIV7_PSEPS|nr:hypothetical protein [Pseudarthrobacter phenanthrenivorans]KIC68742.1 hypothetical protein RM50_04635 [Pseudarthrobacter phenanthrenivorans]
MTQNQNQNRPEKLTDLQNHEKFLAAYEAMSEEEKAAHINQHEAIIDTAVEIFEMATGYSGVDVRVEGHFGKDVLIYRGRYIWIKREFGVDRRYPVEVQLAQVARGLGLIEKEYKNWEFEKELRELLATADTKKKD